MDMPPRPPLGVLAGVAGEALVFVPTNATSESFAFCFSLPYLPLNTSCIPCIGHRAAESSRVYQGCVRGAAWTGEDREGTLGLLCGCRGSGCCLCIEYMN